MCWLYDKEYKNGNQMKVLIIMVWLSNKYKDEVYEQKAINDIFWDLENDCLN